MAVEPAPVREQIGLAAMDHRVLRFTGCAAFGVFIAWMAAIAVLDRPIPPIASWLRYWQHIPLWFAMALAAAYYGRAMERGIRPSHVRRAIAVALIALPAGTSWITSGWESAVTVALALAAWIPFTATWAVPVAACLGFRNRAAVAGIGILCASVPLAWAALPAAVSILGLATPERAGAPWRMGATLAVSTATLVIGTAVLVTLRARRAARRAASPAEPAPSSHPGFPGP